MRRDVHDRNGYPVVLYSHRIDDRMGYGATTRIDIDLPGMRTPENRAHAHRCLPVVLRVRGLSYPAQAQAGRLLRFLLLRLGALSAGSNFREILLPMTHPRFVPPIAIRKWAQTVARNPVSLPGIMRRATGA